MKLLLPSEILGFMMCFSLTGCTLFNPPLGKVRVIDQFGEPVAGAFEFPDMGWARPRTNQSSNILPLYNNPARIHAYGYENKTVNWEPSNRRMENVELERILDLDTIHEFQGR